MRTRMYEPIPDEVRELPTDRRRYLFGTVRRGEQVDKRKEAKAAVAMADWMIRQRDTTYLQLLSAPIVLVAIAILLVIGFTGTTGPWPDRVVIAIANLVPFLGVMLAVRGIAWLMFRRAPEARQANLDLLQRRKRG